MTNKQLKAKVAESAAIQHLADLKEKMDELGITTAAIAYEAGVAPSYLGEILNGKRGVSFQKFITICHALTVCSGKVYKVTIQ